MVFVGLFNKKILNKNRKIIKDINPVKDPSSPSCKRCELDVVYSSWIRSVDAKVLSSPPGKYGRKAET